MRDVRGVGWAKLTLLLLRCVFLSLCANVSLQILLKLHLEHVNIATVCCRNRKKKTPDAQSPKKVKPKAMLDPSPPSAHPCSSSGYAFFTISLCFVLFFRTFISLVIHFHSYLHAKVRSIGTFSCSFASAFVWDLRGIAFGFCFSFYNFFTIDASVFFLFFFLLYLYWYFCGGLFEIRGIGCGTFDSRTVLALVLRFQLIRRRCPDFPVVFLGKGRCKGWDSDGNYVLWGCFRDRINL